MGNNHPWDIPILFDDADLLVVAKPAGLLAIRDGYDPAKPHLRALLEENHGPLWVVHRLDKDTSGLMILGRNPAAHKHLNAQFAAHRVTKTYHALVTGSPDWAQTEINAPLRSGVGRRNRTTVDWRRGKPAQTEIMVLQRFSAHTLIAARPRTGRTHQIRAHLYHLGHPLLADPLYGIGQPSRLISRMALHARTLSFLHPATNNSIELTAEYPPDFAAALLG